MSANGTTTEPVEVIVRAGDCPCPGTPHQDEKVYLRPKVDLRMGMAASTAAMLAGRESGDVQAALGLAYLRHGIVAWTFTDAERKPIPVTPEAIEELLPWASGGYEVADRADDLYGVTVTAPLLRRRSASPPPTDDDSSTGRNPSSGPPIPPSSPRPSRSIPAAGTQS